MTTTKKLLRYIVRDSATGSGVMGEFDTLDEAEKLIEEFEAEDKAEGNFENDFYEIKREYNIEDLVKYAEPQIRSVYRDTDFLDIDAFADDIEEAIGEGREEFEISGVYTKSKNPELIRFC